MKRIYECIANCTRSKRPRLIGPLNTSYDKKILVSASHLYNYMIGDPLVDWLKYIRNPSPVHTTSNNESFQRFIKNKGNDFENEIVNYIHKNKVPVVKISDQITNETIEKTKEFMKKGIPVIHSAPVRNNYNGTQGVIDLLVRSDYISKIVDIDPLPENEKNIPSKILNKPYHYIVIDIKFSTLPLRADGIHLLNTASYPAYKAQCLVYTEAVGRIQGYTSRYAFILGRRWKYTKLNITNRNFTCLNKLGRIDYNGVDYEIRQKTRNAIKWVRDVKIHGNNWVLFPPSRCELYPNMCVDSGEWNDEKKKIADQLGEITKLWYVGVKHRNIALAKGITSWRDEKCTTNNMGLFGVRAPSIDLILEINRQDIDKIRPKKIKNNIYNWKNVCNEVFVDFEMINDVFADFSQLPLQKQTDMIFMIGVGYEEEGEFVYKSFICTKPTMDEEYRIMSEFAELMKQMEFPKMFHWVAEPRFWESAVTRQYNRNNSDVMKIDNWSDLSTVFKEEPIVIKDCFNFGLKNVATAMRKHGMINSCIESNCSNGMTAMINAMKTYETDDDPVNSKIMKDIEKYNNWDCKVLWEIISYLRKNHA